MSLDGARDPYDDRFINPMTADIKIYLGILELLDDQSLDADCGTREMGAQGLRDAPESGKRCGNTVGQATFLLAVAAAEFQRRPLHNVSMVGTLLEDSAPRIGDAKLTSFK